MYREAGSRKETIVTIVTAMAGVARVSTRREFRRAATRHRFFSSLLKSMVRWAHVRGRKGLGGIDGRRSSPLRPRVDAFRALSTHFSGTLCTRAHLLFHRWAASVRWIKRSRGAEAGRSKRSPASRGGQLASKISTVTEKRACPRRTRRMEFIYSM